MLDLHKMMINWLDCLEKYISIYIHGKKMDCCIDSRLLEFKGTTRKSWNVSQISITELNLPFVLRACLTV